MDRRLAVLGVLAILVAAASIAIATDTFEDNRQSAEPSTWFRNATGDASRQSPSYL